MLAVSPGFLDTLAGPHRVTVNIEVRKAGKVLYSGLPFDAGQIVVDATTPVRRRLTLSVPPTLRTGDYTSVPALPRSATDVLGTYGQEAHVTWGLVYTDDSVEWIPAGVFRLDQADGAIAGTGSTVQVTGVSREAYIMDAQFVAPQTLSSPSAQSLIGTLIHQVLPSVEVVVSASRDGRVPTFTTDLDRWQTISDLAESIGAVVFCDGWGRFVIADAPSVTGAPVWTVRAGAGGVLVEASGSTGRAGVFNAVVVRGESPSGDFPPMQAVVYDDDPTSPTRWGDPATGAFGMVPTQRDYPYVTTLEQARAVGRGILARRVGAASTLDVSTVPNPALEGGDLIHVIPDPTDPAGSVRAHVVDGFTIPLVAGSAFPITTRDVREVEA